MVHGDYCIKATSGVKYDYPSQDGFCFASYSFWFTAQLLLIININSKARFLWKAVVSKIDIFAVTLLLALFIILNYSVLLSDNYDRQWDSGTVDPDNDVCKSALTCLFYTSSLGLRNGGGIADSMNLQDPEKTKQWV